MHHGPLMAGPCPSPEFLLLCARRW